MSAIVLSDIWWILLVPIIGMLLIQVAVLAWSIRTTELLDDPMDESRPLHWEGPTEKAGEETSTLPEGLNPGIVETVRWLREKGFATCDSGDGETGDFGCDIPFPYVHMRVEPKDLVAEADRLTAMMMDDRGVKLEPQNEELTAKCVEASYHPQSGMAVLTLWNVRLGKEEA